jgi:hypothetical protein
MTSGPARSCNSASSRLKVEYSTRFTIILLVGEIDRSIILPCSKRRSSHDNEPETELSHFLLIFGEPALLPGESRGAYDLLRLHVAHKLDVKNDVFSQMRVQEVTDSLWEGRRFKRLGTPND